MTKFLLIGKNGQVGNELVRSLGSLGEVVSLGRSEMDLMDLDSMRSGIQQVQPDVIVNAAAYTVVDQAEDEQEQAFLVNATAPAIMAEEAKKLGAWFVHYSTDYVFDGQKKKPYLEEDIPNPLNVYGQSKLKGEEAIQAVGGKVLILRTSWVYGNRGSNFLLTMLKLAKEQKSLSIVDDQISSPTWTCDIARATVFVLEQLLSGVERPGLYHLSASGETSWHDFARAILDECKNRGQSVPELLPISSEKYPRKAVRPHFSVLSKDKLQKTFEVQMPHWKNSLQQYFQQYDRL